MIKMNKPVEALENILERIDAKIDDLQDKISQIELDVWEEDRVLTKAEQKRIDRLNEQIEELEGQQSDIECALDYLREYAE